jgi:glycosyltransferase involved in cell wall biosynthesis
MSLMTFFKDKTILKKNCNGAIYVALGERRFLDEAILSAATLKLHNPNLPVTLYTDCIVNQEICFDEVIQVKGDEHPLKAKVKCITSTPYQKTLYLDTDTLVMKSLMHLFNQCNNVDLIAAKGLVADWSTHPPKLIESSSKTFNTGMILFDNNRRVRHFIKRWYSLTKGQSEDNMWPGHNCDEKYFNQLIKSTRLNKAKRLFVKILPNNSYNVRPPMFYELERESLLDGVYIHHHRHKKFPKPILDVIRQQVLEGNAGSERSPQVKPVNISVVITCCRSGEDIERSLRSLELQTDREFETLIINDKSNDKKMNDLCLELQKEKSINVCFNYTRLGVSATRNRACEIMKGDVYVPLDADDILPSRAIEMIRKTFDQYPEADFVFGDYKRTDVERSVESNLKLVQYCNNRGYLDPVSIALPQGLLMYGGSPFKKSLWEKNGGYDSTLDGREDVDFWLRALLNGAKGKYTPHMLYHWFRSDAGLNASIGFESWVDLYIKRHWEFIVKYSNGRQAIMKYIKVGLNRKKYQIVKDLACFGWRKYPFDIKFGCITILPLPVILLIVRAIRFIRYGSNS